MDKNGFIEYLAERGLEGLPRGEFRKRDPAAYEAAKVHGWIDAVKRERIDWEGMGKEGFVAYLKERGLDGLSRGELQTRDLRAYSAACRNGWISIVKREQPRGRNWSAMGKEGFVKYLQKRNLDKLSRGELQTIDKKAYEAAKNHGWLDVVRTKRDKEEVDWKNLGKAGFEQYLTNKGLAGLSRGELKKRDRHASYAAEKYGWTDILRRAPTEGHYWETMGKKGFIEYLKDRGLFELSPEELQKRDDKAYGAALRHDWLDVLKRQIRKRRDWKNIGREEFLAYLEANGWDTLTPSELARKDSGAYAAARTHGWLDLLKRQIAQRETQAKKFLANNKAASAIASLAVDGYASDVVDILAREWPNAFPVAATLAKQLPRIVPKIGKHLKPLDFPVNEDRLQTIFSKDLPKATRKELAGIVYEIGVQHYQATFNADPRSVLSELERMVNTQQKAEVRSIFKRVHEYYRNAMEFEIPGFGKLREA